MKRLCLAAASVLALSLCLSACAPGLSRLLLKLAKPALPSYKVKRLELPVQLLSH